MVALDSEYEVIRPAKLWCDTESAAEAAELSASLDVPIVASYTASKLLWLKRSEPDAWARLAHLALPLDYLPLALTGALVMAGSDASGLGLLEPRCGRRRPRGSACRRGCPSRPGAATTRCPPSAAAAPPRGAWPSAWARAARASARRRR